MLTNVHQPVKVAIIGTGRVGASCAYALQLRGLASEIVLINTDRQRAEGEAMDIKDPGGMEHHEISEGRAEQRGPAGVSLL